MLTEWHDKGDPQNRPESYEVKSLVFLPQNDNGYLVVSKILQKLFGFNVDLGEN